MSALKSGFKELVLQCQSEGEAMELLKSYRKKNFHLVSKKSHHSEGTATTLKLVKFRQSSTAKDLETVWENFVKEMSDFGIKDNFIAEILRRTQIKDNFWETHPEDHLRDIVMDARNYIKPENLAKVLVYVAPENELINFFCSYQKSVAAAIAELGIFVICPDFMKANIKALKVSSNVQVMSFEKDANLADYQADINAKIGVVLVTPEELGFLSQESLDLNVTGKKLSVLQAPSLVSKKLLKSTDKFIAAGYESRSEVFLALERSLVDDIKIAFLWDQNKVETIMNPEAQVLKTLDNLWPEQDWQRIGNK